MKRRGSFSNISQHWKQSNA